LRQDNGGQAQEQTARSLASPTVMPLEWIRPVSGLMSGVGLTARLPASMTTQWLKAQLSLIYRCGGSAGIEGLHALKDLLTGFPVSLCRPKSQST